MNGFIYDGIEKKIRITDGETSVTLLPEFTVTWENVNKEVAEVAFKLYEKSESIDDFLIKHNCKRFWGNK
ncbi:MAG: hypothetical protein FWD87_08900 [Spirochaetaceae bacterium]|nr:hypothetical protein [Spirochaetaceae bacterium]